MKIKRMLFLILIPFLLISGNNSSWSFLNSSRIGAQKFIKSNLQNDGRGVVIFVMDSGVDVAVPGLQRSSTGALKVIDVMDFSGEGRIYMEEAIADSENHEQLLKNNSGFKLFGYDKLSKLAYDSIYYIGYFDESRLKNSEVTDINGNGRYDDRIGLILYQLAEDAWVAVVDLDADGNVSDEQPQSDYSKTHQFLQFRGTNSLPLHSALKLLPDELAVDFHFDADGHGTHVAGIAAGYNINGQTGLNGIAPGAQIISLKIGDDRLSGAASVSGSMEKAFSYVVAYADTSHHPVVVNMSYGIGAEQEGNSDLGAYLNDLLDNHPNLNICVSAGNEGPGLSSIGLPASARRLISVGAMATPEHLRDVYGNEVSSDKILVFSSRGGEVLKPDVVAPGSAASSVPPFTNDDVMWGTSMASPQVSGAIALLLSAFTKENIPPNFLIKKALQFGAVPIKGYSLLDQGHGVVDVNRSYDLLKEYLKRKSILQDMDILTDSPLAYDGSGSAAYWRSGYYYPTRDDPQSFYIQPNYKHAGEVDGHSKSYAAYDFESDVNWLHVVRKSGYSRSGSNIELEAYLKPEQLKKPGLYSAWINAYKKDGLFTAQSDLTKVFDIGYSVIVPWPLSNQKSIIYDLPNRQLRPGDILREFVYLPVETSGLAISIKAQQRNYGQIRTYVFNPQGKAVGAYASFNSKNSTRVVKRVSGSDMQSGVWEVVYYAPLSNKGVSCFYTTASYASFTVAPATIKSLTVRNGQTPTGTVKMKNNLSSVFDARISGSVEGVQREVQIQAHEADFEYSFTVGDAYRLVVFDLELTKANFNRLTDFSLQILTADERVLASESLTFRKGTIRFTPPASDTYYLKLIPAFASDDNTQWDGLLKVSYSLFKENAIKRDRIKIYPQQEKSVLFRLSNDLPIPPKGYKLFGKLFLNGVTTEAVRVEIPILLRATIY